MGHSTGKAREAAKHPRMHRAAPQEGIIHPEMSAVLRLGNPKPEAAVLFYLTTFPKWGDLTVCVLSSKNDLVAPESLMFSFWSLIYLF